MDHQRFLDYLPDAHTWVQAAQGILEDDLHAAAESFQLCSAITEDAVPGQPDFTPGRFFQPQNKPAKGTLPASAFADERQCFPVVEFESDPHYSVDDPCAAAGKGTAAHVIYLTQVMHCKQGWLYRRLLHSWH